MKSTAAILGLAVLMGGVLALARPTATAEPRSTSLESAVTLGEHWYGDEIDLKDLKGKVVLYEFWGVN